MSDTIDQVTASAILSALGDMQKTLNSQQLLMTQVVRSGERLEKRVDLLERRIGGFEQRINGLEQRINETNERLVDQKEELALMIKMELSGWAANFETKQDLRFERLEEQLDTIARVISPAGDS